MAFKMDRFLDIVSGPGHGPRRDLVGKNRAQRCVFPSGRILKKNLFSHVIVKMPKQTKKKSTAARSRAFAFTIYSDERPIRQDYMRYIAGQREICPTTGRPHWQYFIYLKEAMTLKALIKAVPQEWNKPHIEICMGSMQQNLEYCSKKEGLAGTFMEHGIKPNQGERSDLKVACKEALEGGISAVKSDIALVKFHRGLTAMLSIRKSTTPHIYNKPRVIWLHGETGTGKSREALTFDPCLYKQTSTDGWFDGYYDQKTILIDDFSTGTFPLRELLQLLDGYRYQAKVKGGFVYIDKVTTIFITSHYHPEEYFPKNRYQEILRRISEIRLVGGVSITSPTSVESFEKIDISDL